MREISTIAETFMRRMSVNSSFSLLMPRLKLIADCLALKLV
jgi:hypothetical protein